MQQRKYQEYNSHSSSAAARATNSSKVSRSAKNAGGMQNNDGGVKHHRNQKAELGRQDAAQNPEGQMLFEKEAAGVHDAPRLIHNLETVGSLSTNSKSKQLRGNQYAPSTFAKGQPRPGEWDDGDHARMMHGSLGATTTLNKQTLLSTFLTPD